MGMLPVLWVSFGNLCCGGLPRSPSHEADVGRYQRHNGRAFNLCLCEDDAWRLLWRCSPFLGKI